jgi:hypothetical protein
LLIAAHDVGDRLAVGRLSRYAVSYAVMAGDAAAS